MRRIEVVDDVHIRFPGRDEEFDLGLEIGALAALMALGEQAIQRHVTPACLEQLRPVAEHFRYAVAAASVDDGFDITIRPVTTRPQLRLVSSKA